MGGLDVELDALRSVVDALQPLTGPARRRVVDAAMVFLGSGKVYPEREAVLTMLGNLEPASARTIAAHINKKVTNVHNFLARLQADGLAEKTPEGWRTTG